MDIYKASGIIINDRKVLLTRTYGHDFFITPGGKLEGDETAEQAAVRELNEELSIHVDVADLEFFGEYVAEAANHKGKTVHMKVFTVKKWRGEVKPTAEIEELRWVDSKLPEDIQVGSIFVGEILPRLQKTGLVD